MRFSQASLFDHGPREWGLDGELFHHERAVEARFPSLLASSSPGEMFAAPIPSHGGDDTAAIMDPRPAVATPPFSAPVPPGIAPLGNPGHQLSPRITATLLGPADAFSCSRKSTLDGVRLDHMVPKLLSTTTTGADRTAAPLKSGPKLRAAEDGRVEWGWGGDSPGTLGRLASFDSEASSASFGSHREGSAGGGGNWERESGDALSVQSFDSSSSYDSTVSTASGTVGGGTSGVSDSAGGGEGLGTGREASILPGGGSRAQTPFHCSRGGVVDGTASGRGTGSGLAMGVAPSRLLLPVDHMHHHRRRRGHNHHHRGGGGGYQPGPSFASLDLIPSSKLAALPSNVVAIIPEDDEGAFEGQTAHLSARAARLLPKISGQASTEVPTAGGCPRRQQGITSPLSPIAAEGNVKSALAAPSQVPRLKPLEL